MRDPVDTTNAEHYVWGPVSDGWRLIDKPGLSVIEERVPAGAGEQWHVHDTATQFFYVLEGAPQLQTADGIVELGPRRGVEIPPRLAHRFFNPGPEETRFLVISSPNTRCDRRSLITSANFSFSAENRNIELGVLIRDAALAASVETTMRSKHGSLYELVP